MKKHTWIHRFYSQKYKTHVKYKDNNIYIERDWMACGKCGKQITAKYYTIRHSSDGSVKYKRNICSSQDQFITN